MKKRTFRIEPRNIRSTFPWVATAVFVLVVALLPIRIPRFIRSYGKILPAREWILAKATDGSLIRTLVDNRESVTLSYDAVQVERGDVLRFERAPGLLDNALVVRGDSIGYVFSDLSAQELTRLRGSLEQAKALRQVETSGEKESVLKQAADQAELTREQASYNERAMVRQDSLWKTGLISREEFDLARTSARIAGLEAAIAEANLEALQSGSKPQQILLIDTQILSLEKEIRTLEERIRRLIVFCPLDGRVLANFSPDTLIVVGDTAHVAIIPIPWENRNDVRSGQPIRLNVRFDGRPVRGRVIRVVSTPVLFNNRSFVMAVADIEFAGRVVPGHSIVSCRVEIGREPMRGHVLRFFMNLLRTN